MKTADQWLALMQAEDLYGLPVAETRELPRADAR
jgi:hypothetical protein